MKKIFLVSLLAIVMCFGLVGCNKSEKEKEDKNELNEKKDKNETNEKEEQTETISIDEPSVIEYEDFNNTPIAIYRNNKKVTEYQGRIEGGKDVAMFKVFPSTDDNLSFSGSFGEFFKKKWDEYNTTGTLKIGYNLTYDIEDGRHFSHTIKHVEDNYMYEGYIFIFLYDDYDLAINKKIYKHVDIDEEKDSTLFSSIKLYGGGAASEIITKVYLTVFTYDTDDDFDENGEYRGNSKYTITICDTTMTC